MRLVIYTDGGARGNPGPAGAGVSICDEAGNPKYEAGYFLGHTTNNVAEYTGLLRALDVAVAAGATAVLVKSDSELMVRQLNGEYRVKSENLKDIFDAIMKKLRAIGDWKVTHVYRESNERADELANRAMDRREDLIELDDLTGAADR
ncbi:MAG: ribonuclease H [Phycisphaerae bacterium]|nr:MAG: ribonuclease HI family protein [Planctomycetia bacterium]RIK70611.1 MAG: ribonuclease H [Planctomycetota bacterium]GJQ26294.1 MAG: ribonuclease H [Phycisphaerae bacterium]